MLFKKKKKIQMKSYDKTVQRPVIKASICNGEQVAGFQNLRTGKFEEVMLICGEADLQIFMDSYDIKREEIEKIY
ncbi:MAG: aspartate dehydrogenase [Eubacteriales bacterium]|nr:aspartate dehydrogenase [Eubacteriales bacterium]